MADSRPKQPLDILICTMRALYDEGRFKEAADIAKAAAPYVHPRAEGRAGVGDIATLRDHELDRMDAADGSGTPAAANDPD